jgi:cytidylate kinase
VQKQFLLLRGEPCTGKITVARLLAARLGWHLFWFHDVYRERETAPPSVDAEILPRLDALLKTGADILYVRPSRSRATVDRVRRLVAQYPDYRFRVIRLAATYETLCQRVSGRRDAHRISSVADLDAYQSERPLDRLADEVVVWTDNLTPEQVACGVWESL